MKYKDLYNEWRSDPEQFWMHAAKNINWVKFPTFALDDTKKPFYRWFPDGEVNTCYNAIDRHVIDGKGEKIAIIYDSAIRGIKEKISYKQLLKKVTKFAHALKTEWS